MADDDRKENRVIFTFPNRGRSPQPPRRRRRGRRRGYYYPGHPFFDVDDSSSSDSGDSCSSCDSDYGYAALLPRHRHRRRTADPAPATTTTNRLVRHVVAPAQPQSYGYRRLHVQGGQVEHGGQERGPRRTRDTNRQSHDHDHGHSHLHQQQQPQQQPKCILARCRRWIFGDSAEQRSRRSESGARCCGGGEPQPESPTQHCEEEYWGPGTHVSYLRQRHNPRWTTQRACHADPSSQSWAYGPLEANGDWRGTPWAHGSGPDTLNNPFNLAPGGVVEEVEEGGTLPPVAVTTDRRHGHRGRGRRGSPFIREYANLMRNVERDDAVLGLVDRERDRELDRNMVDRESANRRDLRMMALLDRERERDRGGTDLMDLLERELERRRDLTPGQAGKQSDVWEGEGLRAEIEALRRDLKKLLRDPPATKSGSGPKKRHGVSGNTGIASRSSGRQRPSTTLGVVFGSGDDTTSEDDGGGVEDGEDEDKDDDHEGSESPWAGH